MPRPQPLPKFSSALPNSAEYVSLTPRTPHSRTARAEGGFAELQASDAIDFDDQIPFGQQQSAPLLRSSTSSRFPAGLHPKASKSDSYREPISPFSRVLLIFGILLGGLLLLLTVFSWTRPEALHQYLGLQYPQNQENLTQLSASSPHAPLEYFEECNKLMSGFMSHGDYWDKGHHDMEGMGEEHTAEPEEGTCSSTITYMLDGRVGLAGDLALMAQAAALARERNRTFFVDDTYWNRGKWLDYFADVRQGQPGPEPGCRPPPAKELVACPRTAKHWVISSVTAKFHFGHGFSDHYENPAAHDLNRMKPIFQFSEESFASTIQPNSQTRKLINLAKQELAKVFAASHEQSVQDEPTTSDNLYLAVHMRRGDRIPTGYAYHYEHIPIQVFADAIPSTWNRLHKPTDDIVAKDPVVYIASDSPQAIATLTSLYQGPWYSLGHSQLPELKEIASGVEYHQKIFNAMSETMRLSLTKGAIVDLAMVTGLWNSIRDPIYLDGTICSVSSNFCRLAAIGLGWENAFGEVNGMGRIDDANKRWVDVDVQGREIPIWEPYELF